MNLHIHSTRGSPSSTTRSSSLSLEGVKKKSGVSESILISPRVSEDADLEKEPSSSSLSLYSSLTINQGRLDIASIIEDIVAKADRYDRIAVAACGPDSMIQVARKSAAKNIRVDGPSLELHCEQFGWLILG